MIRANIPDRVLIDTCVVLDVLNGGEHARGSSRLLDLLGDEGRLVIDATIIGELSPSIPTPNRLDRVLPPERVRRLPILPSAGFPAARAFAAYRTRGGAKTTTLCDFLIGGHAEAAGLTILTRDVNRFRTYFPSVPLITPDDA